MMSIQLSEAQVIEKGTSLLSANINGNFSHQSRITYGKIGLNPTFYKLVTNRFAVGAGASASFSFINYTPVLERITQTNLIVGANIGCKYYLKREGWFRPYLYSTFDISALAKPTVGYKPIFLSNNTGIGSHFFITKNWSIDLNLGLTTSHATSVYTPGLRLEPLLRVGVSYIIPNKKKKEIPIN